MSESPHHDAWDYQQKLLPPAFGQGDPGDADYEKSNPDIPLSRDLSRNAMRELADRLRRASAQISRELDRIGRIQHRLLPNPLPRIEGLDIAASYETVAQCGGDLYDFVPLDGASQQTGRWGIFVGDACGHGSEAAVVSAVVQSLLRERPPHVTKPAQWLRRLNTLLCQKPIEPYFVTAFLAVYDPATRRLTYSSAGHPPPLLRSACRGSVTALSSASVYPLGIDEDQEFLQASVSLETGDSLLLYTDGITETRDANGAMFDPQGVERVLQQGEACPRKLIDRILRALSKHSNGVPAADDRTLVALNVLQHP